MAGTAKNTLELAKSIAELVQAVIVVKNALSSVRRLEKVAPATGAVGAVIGVSAAIVKLAMGNVDSEELAYMKEQFQIVRNQLDVISDQIKQVLWEIERSTVNNQYFTIEENLKNQFRKYMDILNAAPEFREKQKKEFLTHFAVTKGDQNVHTLCDAVMGFSAIFGKPILETAMGYDQRNRRFMEGLCSRLKELLCIGLIAMVGHAALTGNDVEALKGEWDEKIAKVESKMTSMIDRCINEFAEQAKIDVEKLIQGKGGRDNEECASYIRDSLVEKYDWVKWSVRVYDPVWGFGNHCIIGDVRCYKGLWENMVHIMKCYKGLWGPCNFPDSYHFWENYSGVTLCVHST
uniref:protein rapunzel-like n=1 Tax=Pristiophorus japonicus TaxID=55135 RepID=UPI00398E7F04